MHRMVHPFLLELFKRIFYPKTHSNSIFEWIQSTPSVIFFPKYSYCHSKSPL